MQSLEKKLPETEKQRMHLNSDKISATNDFGILLGSEGPQYKHGE